MIEVEWTERARADLAGVDAHLAEVDPEFATSFGIAALQAARFLAEWPKSGSLLTNGKRKKRVRGTPYVLLYRLHGERLQILRVRHVRENWRGKP